jgi:hypothetical protein
MVQNFVNRHITLPTQMMAQLHINSLIKCLLKTTFIANKRCDGYIHINLNDQRKVQVIVSVIRYQC